MKLYTIRIVYCSNLNGPFYKADYELTKEQCLSADWVVFYNQWGENTTEIIDVINGKYYELLLPETEDYDTAYNDWIYFMEFELAENEYNFLRLKLL